MMTRLRTLIILSVLGLLSCQSVEVNEQPLPPGIAADKGDPCVPELRRFNLTHQLITNAAPDQYAVKIVTGLDEIKPCMCRVIGYELEVTHNPSTTWGIRTRKGDSIPYETDKGTLIDILKIDDLTEIMEQYWDDIPPEIIAGFDKGPTNLNDILDRATGLCIIENYGGAGGGNNPVFMTEPIIEVINNTPPDTGTSTVAYIPIGITSPI